MGFTLRLSNDGTIERPLLTPPPLDTHKYARGHAVVVSGPVLRTGASRLVAQAALSVGAGLVTIIGDPAALAEHAAHVTAIMLREQDPDFAVIDERVRAVAIGPGKGVSDATAGDVLALLEKRCSILLDADALTSFQQNPERLFGALHGQVVLTPHDGEFGRLFPNISLEDRPQAALRASALAGAMVLLKGATTFIAAPDGRVAVNRHSSSWLATAGSGDVLAGIICGLLAQGHDAFEAAALGAWLHGDIAVRHGPGLTADIMSAQIPLVLQGCLTEG